MRVHILVNATLLYFSWYNATNVCGWGPYFIHMSISMVCMSGIEQSGITQDDVMACFTRCWPFVRGIHQSSVDLVQKGQVKLSCWAEQAVWTNTRVAGDLRRHGAYVTLQ